MTQFLCNVIFSISIITFCSAGHADRCPPNEVRDDCPRADCNVDSCPKYEDYIRNCGTSYRCAAPACSCKFNYKRADNGTCIPTKECPPFQCTRPNEEYVACPPYCPNDDCTQASPRGRCPLLGLLVVVECAPTCVCKKGYWRRDGVCVPFAQCPTLQANQTQADFVIDLISQMSEEYNNQHFKN